MTSSENGINVDNLREHGDPTGTGGAVTDLEAALKGKSFALNQALHRLKTRYMYCF